MTHLHAPPPHAAPPPGKLNQDFDVLGQSYNCVVQHQYDDIATDLRMTKKKNGSVRKFLLSKFKTNDKAHDMSTVTGSGVIILHSSVPNEQSNIVRPLFEQLGTKSSRVLGEHNPKPENKTNDPVLLTVYVCQSSVREKWWDLP